MTTVYDHITLENSKYMPILMIGLAVVGDRKPLIMAAKPAIKNYISRAKPISFPRKEKGNIIFVRGY